MKITDGKRTVEIRMMVWNGTGYEPDWSNDFFDAGLLNFNAEAEAYTVPDVEYCIDAAREWENEEENNTVFIDEPGIESHEPFQGKTFREWCALNPSDDRRIHYNLRGIWEGKQQCATFTSDDSVDALMFYRIQNATIDTLTLIDNEWHVSLVY